MSFSLQGIFDVASLTKHYDIAFPLHISLGFVMTFVKLVVIKSTDLLSIVLTVSHNLLMSFAKYITGVVFALSIHSHRVLDCMVIKGK